jgi:hypothetical protein
LVVTAGLVGCSESREGRSPATAITFPAPDRVPDLTVHVRGDSTFDQVRELMSRLNLRPGSAIDGSRINYEARTVYVYVRTDATPTERQRLREMLTQSSIVVSVEP